jgi:hypothetical protein
MATNCGLVVFGMYILFHARPLFSAGKKYPRIAFTGHGDISPERDEVLFTPNYLAYQ